MSSSKIFITFPTVCAMLDDKAFEEDTNRADALTRDEFKAALKGETFSKSSLIKLLCGAVVPEWRQAEGENLENDLKAIVAHLGIEEARRAFRGKLLVPDRKTLEDTRYEIFATARACVALDAGSVKLEHPIPDSTKDQKNLKNSDIYGTYQGQPVRIEVTVTHADQSEPVDADTIQIHRCSVRPTAPKFMKEDYPNPEGVRDVFDVVDPPDPLSKKMRDMIQKKLLQCEPGVINIVAFGNPGPQNENDLVDALFGAPYVDQPFEVDEHGNRRLVGEAEMRRAPRAPFQAANLCSGADREAFIEPFRLLSGVWHIRLGSLPMSKVISNPNASVPISGALGKSLAQG